MLCLVCRARGHARPKAVSSQPPQSPPDTPRVHAGTATASLLPSRCSEVECSAYRLLLMKQWDFQHSELPCCGSIGPTFGPPGHLTLKYTLYLIRAHTSDPYKQGREEFHPSILFSQRDEFALFRSIARSRPDPDDKTPLQSYGVLSMWRMSACPRTVGVWKEKRT